MIVGSVWIALLVPVQFKVLDEAPLKVSYHLCSFLGLSIPLDMLFRTVLFPPGW